jgi:6-pyruvoyltetrahydropterin/6-carboxytetrahydropterin synthase
MFNPLWTDDENTQVFGLCANKNYHGHNYELEVTVIGTPNPNTGYVIDLGHLKQLIDEHVTHKLDHSNLNLDVDFMNGILPSSENLVLAIWDQLAPHITEGTLYSIRLYETPRNFVEYRGEVQESESASLPVPQLSR